MAEFCGEFMEKGELKKEPIKLVMTCVYCGAKIENPGLNYCPSCKNVLWDKRVLGRAWL